MSVQDSSLCRVQFDNSLFGFFMAEVGGSSMFVQKQNLHHHVWIVIRINFVSQSMRVKVQNKIF